MPADSDSTLSFPDEPRAELDRTLGELIRVADEVLRTQGRLRALLRANEAVAQQLDLPVVLRRIVEVAVELVQAEYGALGVISSAGGLEQFIHVGMDEHDVQKLGHLPQGKGLLGALIDDPHPISLQHLADDPRSVGFPARHPSMDSFLGVPIKVRDEIYGNLYLTNSAAGKFSEADEELVTALAATAGFAIDNARLFAESKRARAWATASAEITSDLLSSVDSDTVSLVLARILELADADLVFLTSHTEDPELLVVTAAQGSDAEQIIGTRYPKDHSVAWSVIEGGQPRRIDEQSLPSAAKTGVLPIGPTLAVPLLAVGGARGALLVSRRPGGAQFAPSDLDLAADFAGQASVAFEIADARASRQRMELLEDRGRIARDLHDHVIQQLFATGLQLQALVGSTSPAAVSAGIEQSISNIDASIAQIRVAIFALASSPNDQADTVRHRILDLVSELSHGLSAEPQVTFAGAIDLAVTGELADDVVAVVRESLTNAVKHSGATSLTIRVAAEDGEVRVLVSDNGVGIPEGGRRSGLANLERRAKGRDGSFEVTSSPGNTELTWSASYSSARET